MAVRAYFLAVDCACGEGYDILRQSAGAKASKQLIDMANRIVNMAVRGLVYAVNVLGLGPWALEAHQAMIASWLLWPAGMALHLASCRSLQGIHVALIGAACSGELAMVQALLAAGADVDRSIQV